MLRTWHGCWPSLLTRLKPDALTSLACDGTSATAERYANHKVAGWHTSSAAAAGSPRSRRYSVTLTARRPGP